MEESLGTRLLRQIKEVCEIAGVKTEEYARISRKRIDVLSLDREISKEKTALGDRVYALASRGDAGEVLQDVTVQAILSRITNLEGSLAECAEEIATLRETARARAGDIRRKYEAERAAAEAPGADPPPAGTPPPPAKAAQAPAGPPPPPAETTPPPGADPAGPASPPSEAPTGEAPKAGATPGETESGEPPAAAKKPGPTKRTRAPRKGEPGEASS